MSRLWLGVAALMLLPVAVLCEEPSQTATGVTVVGVQSLERPRSVVYLGKEVPVYTYDKLYDVAVRVGDNVIIGRFYPPTDYFPGAWKKGTAVRARVDKHFLYLRRNDVEEERLPIQRRFTWQQWLHGVPPGTLSPTDIPASVPQPLR
jgi:hypothetical protein